MKINSIAFKRNFSLNKISYTAKKSRNIKNKPKNDFAIVYNGVLYEDKQEYQTALNKEKLKSLCKKSKINFDIEKTYSYLVQLEQTMLKNKIFADFDDTIAIFEAMGYSEENLSGLNNEAINNQIKALILSKLIKLGFIKKPKENFKILYKAQFEQIIKSLPISKKAAEEIISGVNSPSKIYKIFDNLVLSQIRLGSAENFRNNKLSAREYFEIMKKADPEIKKQDGKMIIAFLEKGIPLQNTMKLINAGLTKTGIDYTKLLEEIDDSKNTTIILKQLQNNSGYLLRTESGNCDEEFDSLIKIIKTFNKDGTVSIQRREIHKDGQNYARITDANQSVKYHCNKGGISDMIQYDFKTDLENSSLIYTTPSNILQGGYVVSRFQLKDYPQSTNIEKAIIDNKIKPKDYLSKVEKNQDTLTLEENYSQGNIETKRKYLEQKNEKGEIIKTQYSYLIKDENDDTLLNINRIFEKISDNQTYTKINDYELVCIFDEENEKITVLNLTLNIKTIIDISSKLKWKKYRKQIFDSLKNLPANALLDINRGTNEIKYAKDAAFITDGDSMYRLQVNLEDAVTLHEIGHALEFLLSKNHKLTKDKELVEIYNKEQQNFTKQNPQSLERFVDYFSQYGGGTFNTGLEEFIAETYMLLNTYNYKKDEELMTRAHFLVRYFPQTISTIAKKLGY